MLNFFFLPSYNFILQIAIYNSNAMKKQNLAKIVEKSPKINSRNEKWENDTSQQHIRSLLNNSSNSAKYIFDLFYCVIYLTSPHTHYTLR